MLPCAMYESGGKLETEHNWKDSPAEGVEPDPPLRSHLLVSGHVLISAGQVLGFIGS